MLLDCLNRISAGVGALVNMTILFRASIKEIRKALLKRMVDDDMKKIFRNSCFLILASKGLAIASPWFLKGVVDTMSLGGALDLNSLWLGIGAFGITRLLSTASQEYRMFMIADFIQRGIRRISFDAFKHLHALDLNFHKTSSKNTVFAINRALRSIESALRFSLGFFTPVAVEFLMLCGMLHFYCGPKYLGNMILTLAAYTYYSKTVSANRRVWIREQKDAEKKSEFTLNESIMNYETVKAFNNEKYEEKRYTGLLDNLKKCAMLVQKSLSELNTGQAIIFTTGLTLNLFLASADVVSGAMTPGDFVLI